MKGLFLFVVASATQHSMTLHKSKKGQNWS